MYSVLNSLTQITTKVDRKCYQPVIHLNVHYLLGTLDQHPYRSLTKRQDYHLPGECTEKCLKIIFNPYE